MDRPNLVLVHSHDTGRHLGVYGAPAPTPNLERLARRGTLFHRAFCASPGCSPSRAAMLTGLTAHESGMLGLAHRGFALRDPSRHLSHRLREAGYRTALVGFQHEVGHDEVRSVLGYDEVVEGLPVLSQPRAAAAAEWLRRGPREPFFLNVGLIETHRLGEAQTFADPVGGDDERFAGNLPWLADSPENRRDLAGFRQAVANVDEAVGLLMDTLDECGLTERTLFVYTTDHGVAFPRAKATLFDAGLGVALVMAGPGVPAGRDEEGLTSHVDLYPTWLEAAGAAVPDPVRGTSLFARWRGEAAPRDAVFGEITYHAAYDPARSVRTDRWKYIRRFADHPRHVWPNVDDSPSKLALHRAGANGLPRPAEALYDLAADPQEFENLADDPGHRPILDALRARLDDWMRETDDPLLAGPVPVPAGAFATPTDAYTPDGGPPPE